MEIEVDWDLHAVVRGCYTTNNNLKNQQQQQPPHVEKVDQNHDKLFRHESMLNLDSFTTSTTTSVVTLAPPSPPPPPPQHQSPELFDQLFRPFLISPLFTPTTESRNRHLEPSISSSNLLHPRNTTTTASRSKRRKNQFKKVCEVPAAGLATDDKWSWRKYGQKPIKGSPYPRGYYRCSSSKGCPARKQVERSKTDPNKFIITYTSEHNHPAPTHRNSLAGISRHHQNSNKLNVLQSSKPGGTSSSSVPTSPSDDDDDEMQQSVKTEVTQYELDEILCHVEDDEKEVLLDDDFFDGLDEMKLPLGHQMAPI